MGSRRATLLFAALVMASGARDLRSSEANGQAKASAALRECFPRGGFPNFFARVEKPEAARIAYLGGSITAQDGWRPKTLKLFQQRYPKAPISEINAAIGGTGSDLGVFRLGNDVLAHKPHLLFIEFAVNDAGASPAQIHRCMEGIVRRTWQADPFTDICFVYTIAGNMLETLKSGKLPRSYSAMEELANHCGIPSINFGLEVARLEAAGKLVFKGEKPANATNSLSPRNPIVFSPDAVHPYPDTGHQLYLEAVQRSLSGLRSAGKLDPHALGAPFIADNWEKAKMIPLHRAKLSAGWKQLNAATENLARNFGQRLPEVWRVSEPGETLTFSFQGTAASVYDLLGPDCGQVTVELDDRPGEIRPRFDAYCTYHRLATLWLGSELPDRVHTVKITLNPDQPDKPRILAQRGEKMDDPKRFEGRDWYAGALLIVGDLVEQ